MYIINIIFSAPWTPSSIPLIPSSYPFTVVLVGMVTHVESLCSSLQCIESHAPDTCGKADAIVCVGKRERCWQPLTVISRVSRWWARACHESAGLSARPSVAQYSSKRDNLLDFVEISDMGSKGTFRDPSCTLQPYIPNNDGSYTDGHCDGKAGSARNTTPPSVQCFHSATSIWSVCSYYNRFGLGSFAMVRT